MASCQTTDLLIVGGGPAGLSAVINAASEGLSVRVLDSAPTFGGQARESNAIENYLGFPQGVTGDELMSKAVQQARKFGNISFLCPVSALDLRHDDTAHVSCITTDDGSEYVGRAVLLANGLSYRRLGADNIGPFVGRGVFYGAPIGTMPTNTKCRVAIVGGANSAGQAAVKLSLNKKANVYMFIRKKLELQMSEYLVKRIRSAENITVCEGCEVTRVDGTDRLEQIMFKDETGTVTALKMNFMYIFIGASPRTVWLRGAVNLDNHGFIMTGANGYLYETSITGVFAAGDVRAGSTKRIAASIGEGSTAVEMIHKYLDNVGG